MNTEKTNTSEHRRISLDDIKMVSLSSEQKSDFIKFVKSIEYITFLHPYSSPNKKWKMTYGDSWNSAYEKTLYKTLKKKIDQTYEKAYDLIEVIINKTGSFELIKDSVNASLVIHDYLQSNPGFKNIPLEDPQQEYIRDTIFDAERDATLIARYLLVANLDIPNKEKYFKYLKSRWDIWKAGYSLLCDANNTLYVYTVGKPKHFKMVGKLLRE